MAKQESPLTNLFVEFACDRLEDCRQQIERCIGLLTVDQVWHRPNSVSNAIGNLVIHLNGNVRQWILSGIAGEPDHRNRPTEFAQRDTIPSEEIIGELNKTVENARQTIASLSEQRLSESADVQGRTTTVLGIVFHVVEHFSLHTGQIVYATKIILDKDLSLYDPHGNRIDPTSSSAP